MSQNLPLELMLFESDPASARHALGFGVSHFLVDWETQGKGQRQAGYDTEINAATVGELRAVSALPGAKVWCRINRWGPWSPAEVEAALAAGACGIFLPMVRKLEEVERFIAAIGGRCAAAILVETPEAVALAAELARLPLERVYFGLNDFAICRGRRFIFDALRDGTVERVGGQLQGIRFGFGGATAVELGAPVPCRMLLEEMARLGCQFTFLRRSFRRDIAGRDPAAVVEGIQAYWQVLQNRSPQAVEADAHRLLSLLQPLCA